MKKRGLKQERAHEDVMARAKKMFPNVKPRKSGAGNYSAAQLLEVYDSLRKEE
jgi:hypothetical protein